MILAVTGGILIICGVIMVVRKTAETWAHRRAGGLHEGGEKPKVSHIAIILIAIGTALMLLASSGWL
jgi:hypothetical protein